MDSSGSNWPIVEATVCQTKVIFAAACNKYTEPQPCSKLSTSSQQAGNKLLKQHCYRSAAGLLQVERLYVYINDTFK